MSRQRLAFVLHQQLAAHARRVLVFLHRGVVGVPIADRLHVLAAHHLGHEGLDRLTRGHVRLPITDLKSENNRPLVDKSIGGEDADC